MDLDSSLDSTSALDSASTVAEVVACGAPLITVEDTRPVASSIKVSSAILRAVAGWASKDETRFHLIGVLVDGTTLVATDGHRLVKVSGVASGVVGTGFRAPTDRYIVPTASIASACKLAGARGSLLIERGTIRAFGPVPGYRNGSPSGEAPEVGSLAFKPIDALFPPYEQVIPHVDSWKLGRVGINVAYLAACEDLCKALDASDGHRGVRLVSGGGSTGYDPLVFEYEDVTRTVLATMVIMPMRVDFDRKREDAPSTKKKGGKRR